MLAIQYRADRAIPHLGDFQLLVFRMQNQEAHPEAVMSLLHSSVPKHQRNTYSGDSEAACPDPLQDMSPRPQHQAHRQAACLDHPRT
jgi:hypothetical protein